MKVTCWDPDKGAKSVPGRWANQYRWHTGSDKTDITKKLLSIPRRELTADKVSEIIGVNGRDWCRGYCDMCYKRVDSWVEFDDKDGEPSGCICSSCVNKAVEALKESK